MNLILRMYEERLKPYKKQIELVFEDAGEVELIDVWKTPRGHGHYTVGVHVIINGKERKFARLTSNMELIDDWFDNDGNITSKTIFILLSITFCEEIEEYILNDF